MRHSSKFRIALLIAIVMRILPAQLPPGATLITDKQVVESTLYLQSGAFSFRAPQGFNWYLMTNAHVTDDPARSLFLADTFLMYNAATNERCPLTVAKSSGPIPFSAEFAQAMVKGMTGVFTDSGFTVTEISIINSDTVLKDSYQFSFFTKLPSGQSMYTCGFLIQVLPDTCLTISCYSSENKSTPAFEALAHSLKIYP